MDGNLVPDSRRGVASATDEFRGWVPHPFTLSLEGLALGLEGESKGAEGSLRRVAFECERLYSRPIRNW